MILFISSPALGIIYKNYKLKLNKARESPGQVSEKFMIYRSFNVSRPSQGQITEIFTYGSARRFYVLQLVLKQKFKIIF